MLWTLTQKHKNVDGEDVYLSALQQWLPPEKEGGKWEVYQRVFKFIQKAVFLKLKKGGKERRREGGKRKRGPIC